MRTVVLTLVGGLIMAGAASAAGPISVKLTVTERAGFDRVDEPVTFGVPLPAGAVMDPQSLCLLDEQGKAIPASFREAQRWQAQPGREGAGSLAWVHVTCLLNVPAKGSKTITLTNAPPQGVTAGSIKYPPVTIEADAGKAKIVTGPVTLALNANLPGVIESASSGDKQVISGAKDSGVQAGGKTFTEIEPATAKVEVLESGPLRAVVLLKGKFKDSNSIGAVAEIPNQTDEADKAVNAKAAEDGKARGPGLMYEARVYAYAGSPRVFIDYTIVNKIGMVAANKIDLQDLSLRWQTSGAGDVMISRPGMPLVRKIDAAADIAAMTATEYEVAADGQSVVKGATKAAKPATLGWASTTAAGAAVAVGIRDFWETFPKQLSIVRVSDRAGMTFRIGLYPQECKQPQELFIGQARTHRITLLFHDGKADPMKLNAVFAAANVPLLPLAEPAWYCQKTQCWGPITSADCDYGQFADVEKQYDKVLSDSMDNIVRNVESGLTAVKKAKDGTVVKSVTQDGYGWLNWGDSLFRIGTDGGDFKEPHKNLSWNGNYYDYGMTMVYQWARTGDLRMLEHGLRAGAYTADVFINHWYPEPERIGACHYCPPRYHAAIDDGTPCVSEQFNHAKVASVVMRWQLLGDWWVRQVMLESFNHAEAMVGSENAAWRQCRGNGHRLHMLWCAYQFSGDPKCVDRAGKLLALGVAFIKKETEFDKRPQQRFMVGVALEGMIQSMWIKPDPAVLDTVRFVADYAVKEQNLKGYTANMAMAYGYLWQQTGDPAYLRTVARLLRTLKPTEHAKYFGQTFRSTPYALGYLQEATAKGVKLPATQPETPAALNDMMMMQEK